MYIRLILGIRNTKNYWRSFRTHKTHKSFHQSHKIQNKNTETVAFICANQE